jgi:imidazolonepropionase-like amidohydrolase
MNVNNTLKRWIAGLLFGLVASCVAAASSGASESPHRFRVKTIYTGSGAPIQDGVLTVRDGKVVRVEAAGESTDAASSETMTVLADAVIVPGLIDLLAAPGATGQLSEPTSAVQADVRSVDVLAPGHADFDEALAAGITTVVLLPRWDNLVGGVAAAVKTSGPSLDARTIRTDGPLALSVGRAVARRDRIPTARMGVYDLFRRTLEGAASESGESGLAAFARGKLDGLVHCSDASDARFVLGQIGERGLQGAIFLGGPVDDMLDELAESGVPIVLGPFALDTSERMLRTPGKLAERGLPIALAGAFPEAPLQGLRLTAALAARHGLATEHAVPAMTSVPARVAGIGDRVGSLAPGRDADFVILSGAPLDLSSRVLAVYIDGKRVYWGERLP